MKELVKLISSVQVVISGCNQVVRLLTGGEEVRGLTAEERWLRVWRGHHTTALK